MADYIGIILWTAVGLLSLVAVLLVAWAIRMEKKYRHRAIIKDPNNRAQRVIFDRFRVYKGTDGITMYKFRKLKTIVPPLPAECVEVDHKGRMVGTWYRIDEDNFIPGKDGYERVDEQEFIQSIKPFKTEQRALTIAQYKKSERDRKTSWKDLIEKAVPYVVIIMMLALMLIFMPDIMNNRAAIDAAADERVNEVLDALVTTTANLDRIVNDRGVITGSEAASGNENVVAEAPN